MGGSAVRPPPRPASQHWSGLESWPVSPRSLTLGKPLSVSALGEGRIPWAVPLSYSHTIAVCWHAGHAEQIIVFLALMSSASSLLPKPRVQIAGVHIGLQRAVAGWSLLAESRSGEWQEVGPSPALSPGALAGVPVTVGFGRWHVHVLGWGSHHHFGTLYGSYLEPMGGNLISCHRKWLSW